MLAAQAKLEKMPLATVDALLKDFPVQIFTEKHETSMKS
jgi:PIN domain nuclease of toxin-antitoxin system